MSDKYGRIYPERAIAPLRALLEDALVQAKTYNVARTTIQAKAIEDVLDDLDSLEIIGPYCRKCDPAAMKEEQRDEQRGQR